MKKVFFIFFLSCAFIYSQESSKTYTVLKKIGEIEIREYKQLLYASYLDDEPIAESSSSFRVLANYIFGYNKKNEEISMTSPVVIRLFNNNEMLFRMPDKYTFKNIPQPINEEVKLIKTEEVKKAVIQYAGYSNAMIEKQKIKELSIILDENNIRYNNEFELFVYDPPYKFFNRKNEISVNLD